MAEDDEVGERGLARMLAFSDGVFAVAITLLVLDLSVATGLTPGGFRHALAYLVPSMLSAALSFVVVGTFWTRHHDIFTMIRHIDPALLRLNLVFLAPIVFLPFATELLGGYGNLPAAVVIYAAAVAGASLSLTAVVRHASRSPRLVPSEQQRQRLRAAVRRGIPVAVVFGLSMPVAIASPTAAEVMWASLALPFVRGRKPKE